MPEKINTGVMPGDSMSPDLIAAAASGMGTVGTRVSTNGTLVLADWQKLRASYDAPEGDLLLHAMDPVKTEAEAFGTDVATAAAALKVFAEEVRAIKAAVATIRAEAATFLADVAGGVEKKHYGAQGATSTTTVDWHEDQGSVDTNNSLVRRTNDQQEALWAAERKCANAIYDSIGHARITAATDASGSQGYGVDQIPDNAAMPWGQTVQRTENCGERAVRGVVGDGGGAMLGGFASLVGFEYTGKGLWDQWDWSWDHSWSHAGEAWKGVGMFGVGAVSMAVPGLASTPGPFGNFIRDSQKVTQSAVAGLVAIDLYADDPYHKWKEDGWRALGESIFNVGTLVVAPTKLGNAGKLGRTGQTAAKLTDPLYLAAQASRAARALAGSSVEALARLNRAADLDGSVAVRQVEIDIPSVRNGDVSTDVPNVGSRTDSDAPAPRDYAGDREAAADGGEPSTSTRDSVDTPDRAGDPADPARPATDGTPDTTANPQPADTTPVNDPSLAKSHQDVRTQVDQIRSDIGPELQRHADEAWQRAADRADREGFTDPSARRLGSYAHVELSHSLNAHRNDLVSADSGYRIRPEVSFDSAADEVAYGSRGSVRPDIVIERLDAAGEYEVVHVIDLKTGAAGISATWENKVQTWLKPLSPSETLRPRVPVPTTP